MSPSIDDNGLMGSNESVTFYNRYTGQIETEAIYGESYLKFIYGNPLGKLALWAAVKRAIFSKWYGFRMSSNRSVKKIAPFISEYDLDVGLFLDRPESFRSFNDFFSRKLKTESRPITGKENELVFPADGRHIVVKDLSSKQSIWAKGQSFDLHSLLGSKKRAERFKYGSALISRLCPTDYHRFHFPCQGVASDAELINGHLYSVNPLALKKNISYLWQNKRSITELKSDTFGNVCLLEIGATCVGCIEQTYQQGNISKGQEKGYFSFGGSMTIVLLEPKKVTFSSDLLEHSENGTEVYAVMGDICAQAK
tara:strand:+ start:218 stop:1147 length:930 start_codon:yes stop_codon:yes gene_type:complete